MAENPLIDHYKKSPYRGVLQQADRQVHVRNRSCGDSILFTAYISKAGTIEDMRFEAQGCFYCQVSASIACEVLIGCTKSEAEGLSITVRRWLAGQEITGGDARLETVKPLGEVRQYPMRIACADLAWEGVEQLIRAGESI